MNDQEKTPGAAVFNFPETKGMIITQQPKPSQEQPKLVDERYPDPKRVVVCSIH